MFQARPLLEVTVVYVGVCAATAVITYLPRVLPGLHGYSDLLFGAVFLLTAGRLARREPDGMRRFGIDLAGLLEPPADDDPRPAGPLGMYDLVRALRRALPIGARELVIALACAVVIFPAYTFGYYVWHAPTQPFALVFPADFGELVAAQLLVVALPEEAFFRGYVQTRLRDALGPERTIFGIQLEWRSWLLQAALFALIHFVSIPHPARLAVFFPGLLFGLLRAWRGGIGAALALHAMSNVLARLLEDGWH